MQERNLIQATSNLFTKKIKSVDFNKNWYGKLVPIDVSKIEHEITNLLGSQVQDILSLVEATRIREAELKLKELESTLKKEKKYEAFEYNLNMIKSQVLCAKCFLAINDEYQSPNFIINLLKDNNFNKHSCIEQTAKEQFLYDLSDLNIYFSINSKNINSIANKVFDVFSANVFKQGRFISQFFVDSIVEVRKLSLVPSESDYQSTVIDSSTSFLIKQDYLNQMAAKESDESILLFDLSTNTENNTILKNFLFKNNELSIIISKEYQTSSGSFLFNNKSEIILRFKLVKSNRYVLKKHTQTFNKILTSTSDE